VQDWLPINVHDVDVDRAVKVDIVVTEGELESARRSAVFLTVSTELIESVKCLFIDFMAGSL
jgi:hypothetical protein